VASFSLTPLAARRLHVAALGLDRRPRRQARKADVLDAIRRMGALQIDTIHVVARSPYLVLFSRLGAYRPDWLDELLAEGALFEYWAHEACFLPIEKYALFRHRMLDPAAMGWKYRADWVAKHRDQMERVLELVRRNGAVRSADFERRPGSGPSGWWEWKPEKRALEALFTAGELMVAKRQSFQRVYDLRTRVHPDWDDAELPPRADVDRRLVLDSVRTLGVTTARWVGDYYRMRKGTAQPLVQELAEAGRLRTARVKGWREPAYVHPENAELVERAAAGKVRCTLTTVLSPFDPLVWDRARARAMFDFDYSIECYTPAPKRRYGYYVLPILCRGDLVGRLDAKAHRTAGEFEVKALYLEPGVRASEALATDVAAALAEVAAWHGTPTLVVRRAEPAAFKASLARALR
jgi:uncharacterized protein YcaQ